MTVTAIKFAQYVLAAVTLVCLVFGFGTAWFTVGMFAGLVVFLILDGLLRGIRKAQAEQRLADWEARRIPASVMFAHLHDEWDRRGHVETVHHHPQNWQVIEGGKRPVWPNEIGSPE